MAENNPPVRKGGGIAGFLNALSTLPEAIPAGILRGGARTGDLLYSILSSGFRERDPESSWAGHVFGEQPLTSRIDEFQRASDQAFGPQPAPYRYARSVAEEVPDAFLLSGVSKLMKGAELFPKVFKGSAPSRSAIVGAGLGGQAGEDIGEAFAPGLGALGRFGGSVSTPYLLARTLNRARAPRISIPDVLDPEQQQVLKGLSGNKRFKDPMIKFAERAEKANKKSELNLLKDVRQDFRELKSAPKQSLENNPIDTKDLVSSLKNERSKYQKIGYTPRRTKYLSRVARQAKNDVNDLRQNIGQSPKLDRTKYLDKIARQANKLTVEGVNALRQDIGKNIGKKSGAAEAYRIVSDFLEKKVPNYRNVIGRNDLSRQASLVSKEFERSLAGSRGNVGRAAQSFKTRIGNKAANQDLNIDRLIEDNVPGAQKLQNIVNKVQNYEATPQVLTRDQILENIGKRSLTDKRSYLEDTFDKGFLRGVVKLGSDAFLPSQEQKLFQSLVPGQFEKLGKSALQGGLLDTMQGGFLPSMVNNPPPIVSMLATPLRSVVSSMVPGQADPQDSSPSFELGEAPPFVDPFADIGVDGSYDQQISGEQYAAPEGFVDPFADIGR